MRADGPVNEVLDEYRADVDATADAAPRRPGRIALRHAQVGTAEGESMVRSGGRLDVDLTLETEDEYRAWMYVGVTEGTATPIFMITPGSHIMLAPGGTHVRCSVEALPLPRGRFYLWAGVCHGAADGPQLVQSKCRTLRRVRARDRSHAARGGTAVARARRLPVDLRACLAP